MKAVLIIIFWIELSRVVVILTPRGNCVCYSEATVSARARISTIEFICASTRIFNAAHDLHVVWLRQLKFTMPVEKEMTQYLRRILCNWE